MGHGPDPLTEEGRPKILIAIPMHGYVEGVIHLIRWFTASTVLARRSFTIMVFDDRSSPADQRAVAQEALGNEDVVVIPIPEGLGGGPRYAFQRAGELARAAAYYTVLTCESDAVPSDETFEIMLRAFQKPPVERPLTHKVVSISPTYHHPDTLESCYPANPNWTRPGHGNCYVLKDVEGYGRVGYADAVPFLFTLWRPEALLEINHSMPRLLHLDTTLGRLLTAQGKIHLRLLDHSIGHAGGGRMSRGLPGRTVVG